jgi:hypothetical protein
MRLLIILCSVLGLVSCDLLEPTEQYKTDQEMLDFLIENELNFNALIEHKEYCNNDTLPAICSELMKSLEIERYRYGNTISEGEITSETIFLASFHESYGLLGAFNTYDKGYIYTTSEYLDAESFGRYILTDQELERDSSHYGYTSLAKIILKTEEGTWLVYSEQLDD